MQPQRRRIEPVASFATLHEELSARHGGLPEAVRRLRGDAFARFSELGFPNRRHEFWKYTDIAKVANRPMRPAPAAELATVHVAPHLGGGPNTRRLIFANGHLLPALSHARGLPAGVRVESLAEALASRPEELAELIGRGDDGRGLTALNAAFADAGAVIEVADGVVVDMPLQLLFLTSGPHQAVMSHPRLIVRLGAGARLTLLESHVALDEGGAFTNLVGQVDLGRDAELLHERVERLRDATSLAGKFEVRLAEQARYTQNLAITSGGFIRNEIETRLDGPGGEALLNGFYLPTGREHVDNLIRIVHGAPGCHSDQLYKGVVGGHAHAVFAGKIIVEKPAQQTNAYQANNNLLVSDDAEIDTKPELEIYADDVKCSHGATVGDLDAVSLFYLRSRGLSEDLARGLLTFAFVSEVIARFRDPALIRQIRRTVAERLGNPSIVEELT